MKLDKKTLGRMNKRNVIEIIRKNGPINKAEIAKQADLSIPTVMKITEELSRDHLIQCIGKGESNGGKRPELLAMVPNTFYMVGVDIGRSRTIAVVINLSGEVIAERTMKTGATVPEHAFIKKVNLLIYETIEMSEIPEKRILGIGIVTPGLINTERGIVNFSPDFHWENLYILDIIQSEFHMPVYIENSNRALALAEGWFGAAKEASYYICINFGHGIGSAIMEKGSFYRGNSGSSGEIGHMTLEKDGLLCDCGNRGCLEALASGNAIAGQAVKAIRSGIKTTILEFVDNDMERIEAKEVFEAAKTGDELANKIIAQAIEYIGIGVANYINLLDPELIVFTGGMTKAGDFFTDKVKESVKKRKMRFAGNNVKLQVTQLRDNAAAIGGASIILGKFIEQGGNTREG